MGNRRSTKLDEAPADPMASIVGDIGPSIDSFRRHLRASNAAPRTVSTYLEGATQFATFLAAQGMPTNVPDIRREHVEAYIEEILAQRLVAGPTGNGRTRTPAEVRAWLDSLAQFSDKIPPLPGIISREWIYQEHD